MMKHTEEPGCSKLAWDNWVKSPCSRKGKVERDGKWFCTQHDPVRIKEKDDLKYAKRKKDRDAKDRVSKRKSICVNACQNISTTALEAGVIGEMVKTVKDYQYLVEEDYCGVKQTIEYLRNRLGEVKALLAKLEASDNG